MKMERDFSMEPVERALDAMRAGRMVLLVDD